MLKKYLTSLYGKAMELNDRNVNDALDEFWPFHSLLDVGCWDGEKTLEYAKSAKAKKVYGIEIVSEKSQEAQKKWIHVMSLIADKDTWPYEDSSLDCVVSNQVIEHLSDIDHFLSEASRVLKTGWYLITSTNNLSSWHNIFALLLWWTPFDLTNSSKKWIWLWNPLAIHQWEISENGESWTHKTILNTRWMNAWFALFWLQAVKHTWAWYYPFSPRIGKWFPRHSAFITLVNKKT